MADAFREFWGTNFPHCPPVSYFFKSNMPDRWLRIHSLPESKRYPEYDYEVHEILRRQKLIFENVIGENDECFLVGIAFGKYPTHKYPDVCPNLGSLLTEKSEPVLLQDREPDREPDEAFFLEFGRRTGDFDGLNAILLAVAEDKISRFFVLNPKSKRIFAPYDGGVDLIFENEEIRNKYKKDFSEWLSAHPEGL